MSIASAFDGTSEAILTPTHRVSRTVGFPQTVLASLQGGIVRELHEQLQPEEFDSLECVYRVPIYRFSYKGHELALYLSPLGGPASARVLEEIIARGAKRVLFFGTCGALDNAQTDGKLVVPTAAYRDEGTSYHYLPAGDYIEVPTSGRLCDVFDELCLPYVRGRTWTTDALYRETRRNADARRAEGCLTVEMECASVMAVGQFRQFPVYQFLYTADSLDGGAWACRTLGSAHMPKSNYQWQLRTALDTAIRLEGENL